MDRNMGKLRTKSLFNNGKGRIKVSLDLIEFKENNAYIIYSPALDLSGYGYTRREAMNSFSETIRAFLDYAQQNNTLEAELRKLGWNVKQKNDNDVHPPDLFFLMQKNQQLKDIINHQEFKKSVKKLELA